MAYTEIIGDLNVTSIYKELMVASTGQGSTYIKAKETMLEYFTTVNLSEIQKAEMLSNLVVSIAGQTTAHMLDIAVKVATENRDAPYILGKTRAETELAQSQKLKIDNDAKTSAAQTKKLEADINATIINGWKTQADIVTKNGINMSTQTISNPILSSTSVSNELAIDYVQAKNVVASTYTALSSSCLKDGFTTVTTTASTGEITGLTNNTVYSSILTGAQINVAVRQKQGFDDNMRQHAANSAANTIGLMISTENTALISQSLYDSWDAALGYLVINH